VGDRHRRGAEGTLRTVVREDSAVVTCCARVRRGGIMMRRGRPRKDLGRVAGRAVTDRCRDATSTTRCPIQRVSPTPRILKHYRRARHRLPTLTCAQQRPCLRSRLAPHLPLTMPRGQSYQPAKPGNPQVKTPKPPTQDALSVDQGLAKSANSRDLPGVLS